MGKRSSTGSRQSAKCSPKWQPSFLRLIPSPGRVRLAANAFGRASERSAGGRRRTPHSAGLAGERRAAGLAGTVIAAITSPGSTTVSIDTTTSARASATSGREKLQCIFGEQPRHRERRKKFISAASQQSTCGSLIDVGTPSSRICNRDGIAALPATAYSFDNLTGPGRHVAAVVPRSVMNSRRFTRSPRRRALEAWAGREAQQENIHHHRGIHRGRERQER
jgi:hypothetical protein